MLCVSNITGGSTTRAPLTRHHFGFVGTTRNRIQCFTIRVATPNLFAACPRCNHLSRFSAFAASCVKVSQPVPRRNHSIRQRLWPPPLLLPPCLRALFRRRCLTTCRRLAQASATTKTSSRWMLPSVAEGDPSLPRIKVYEEMTPFLKM